MPNYVITGQDGKGSTDHNDIYDWGNALATSTAVNARDTGGQPRVMLTADYLYATYAFEALFMRAPLNTALTACRVFEVSGTSVDTVPNTNDKWNAFTTLTVVREVPSSEFWKHIGNATVWNNITGATLDPDKIDRFKADQASLDSALLALCTDMTFQGDLEVSYGITVAAALASGKVPGWEQATPGVGDAAYNACFAHAYKQMIGITAGFTQVNHNKLVQGWNAAAGLNKAWNPDMESVFDPQGNAGFWGWQTAMNTPSVVPTTDAFANGAKSLKVTASVAGTAGVTNGYTPVNIPITGGKSHALHVKTKAKTTARNVRIVIVFNQSGSNPVESEQIISNSTTGWTLHTVLFDAPAGYNGARLYIEFQGCALNEVHYVDDVYFGERMFT